MKRLILNGLSLWVIDALFGGIVISSSSSLILLTIILSVCNALIKPLLQVFCFPMTLLTFGLFGFVINGMVLLVAFNFVSGATVNGLGTAILASIMLGIINSILTDMFAKD